jgi:hypothetical protein
VVSTLLETTRLPATAASPVECFGAGAAVSPLFRGWPHNKKPPDIAEMSCGLSIASLPSQWSTSNHRLWAGGLQAAALTALSSAIRWDVGLFSFDTPGGGANPLPGTLFSRSGSTQARRSHMRSQGKATLRRCNHPRLA